MDENKDIEQTEKHIKQKPMAFTNDHVPQSTLDIVTSLYKQTLTKEQKETIIKNIFTKDAAVVLAKKSALRGDWKCPEKVDAILFKHLVGSFGISLRNEDLSKERKEILDKIKEFITQFVSSHDIVELIKKFTEVGLNIGKKDIKKVFDTYKLYTEDPEITEKCIDFTIKKQLLSALIPSFRKTKTFTKMELTRQVFGPLFEFTTLFDNCVGGSNSSIKDFTYKYTSTDRIVPDFHPDDFTFVKYGNHECIKLIREDSNDSYQHHTLHKDFIPLIAEMQLCLAFNMRQLLRDPVEDWQEQCVLGVTGEPLKCNVYLLNCQPIASPQGIELCYNLSYLGSFYHYKLEHRIELVSLLISNLCFPKIEKIVKLVTTKIPTCLNITKKKMVVDFPSTLVINDRAYDVKYQELDTLKKNNKVRYCKVNNIDCVIKRGNEGPKCTCLSLVVIAKQSFTVSLRGNCLADLLNDKESEIDEECLFFDILCMLLIFKTERVTHNDIKPENIVNYDNHWFLIDFETCTQFETFYEKRKCFLTEYGSLFTCSSFSEGYRSPERIDFFEFDGLLANGRVSPQSDIYSFGLVMLEVLRRKRIRGMETRSIVDQELKDLDIQNEIIKKQLPLMLETDFEKRPTSFEILSSMSEEQERIEKGIKLYQNTNYFLALFPKASLFKPQMQ